MRALHRFSILVACLILTLAAGCSDDSGGSTDTGAENDTGGTDTGGTDSGEDDTGGTDTGGTDTGEDDTGTIDTSDDTGSTDTGGTDAGDDTGGTDTGSDSGCAGVELTVRNYLAWCSVSVNGEAASSASTQTVCVPGDSAVPLVHTALGGFILGLWHHTDGDTGGGEAGTIDGDESSTTFTTEASGEACVWVCCPFTNGTGCPATDQCD